EPGPARHGPWARAEHVREPGPAETRCVARSSSRPPFQASQPACGCRSLAERTRVDRLGIDPARSPTGLAAAHRCRAASGALRDEPLRNNASPELMLLATRPGNAPNISHRYLSRQPERVSVARVGHLDRWAQVNLANLLRSATRMAQG